jgi:hypothetical protein
VGTQVQTKDNVNHIQYEHTYSKLSRHDLLNVLNIYLPRMHAMKRCVRMQSGLCGNGRQELDGMDVKYALRDVPLSWLARGSLMSMQMSFQSVSPGNTYTRAGKINQQ